MNAQSIVGKINELECVANEFSPSIIIITESWCNDNISNALLKLSGYYLVPELRLDRCDNHRGIGGGILVYVKDNLHILANDNKSDFNQYCNFTVVNNLKQKVTIYVIYRSPNSTNANNETLCELLSDASKNKCVFIGDFNHPKINWENGTSENRKCSEFYNSLTSNNYSQVVDFPTQIRGNILDLVITNEPDLILYTKPVGRLGKSDHEIIEIGLNINQNKDDTERFFYDWKNADVSEMNKYMQRQDWKNSLSHLSTEEAWLKLKTELLGAFHSFVPRKKSMKGNRPDWMDTNTLRMIRKKRRLWSRYKRTRSPEDLTEYNEMEKLTKKTIRKAKRKYEVKLSKKTDFRNAQFRNYIKGKTVATNPIGPLLDVSGKVITDNKVMADQLNTYFSSVFTREDQSNVPVLQAKVSVPDLDNIIFSVTDIEDKISELKDNSAPGPDQISGRLLKSLKTTISKPLQLIFNKSLSEKTAPSEWKDAIVIPIFKKGTKGSPSNYRPVSLTSIVCKIMEKLIKEKIVEHLSTNNLINPSQHGFTKHKSCSTNLLEFFEFVTYQVDRGNAVDVVYLDFAKAFDKVPKLRLLEKIRSMSITGNILGWIENWLTDRRQRVKVGNSLSEWMPVESGVPQGSVFGPEAFRIYINDLDDAVKTLDCINKFADDSKGAKIIKSAQDQILMQTALNNLYEWSVKWGMKFNVSKCKIIHMGKNNPRYEYHIGGEKLQSDTKEKDIGVLINDNLKPSMQCQKAANTAMAVLNQILRAFTYRDRTTYINLYKTYVRPHLEFSSPVWNPWLTSDVERLENVQKKALKQVNGLHETDYLTRVKELGLTTLEERRTYSDLVQTYKIINGIDDVDRKIWFELYGDTERRVTRTSEQSLCIVASRPNLDIRKHFFSNRIVEQWNALPENIKNARNVKQFKKMYMSQVPLP